jgi:hypothetical protein
VAWGSGITKQKKEVRTALIPQGWMSSCRKEAYFGPHFFSPCQFLEPPTSAVVHRNASALNYVHSQSVLRDLHDLFWGLQRLRVSAVKLILDFLRVVSVSSCRSLPSSGWIFSMAAQAVLRDLRQPEV